MAYEQIISINNPDVAVGITLPFARRDGRLFNLSYSTEEQALSNLTNLILTRQGERIMQPFFGTTLQDSLFEQNDDLLKSSITTL
jgi:phage baseplate assembly protein W